MDDKTELLENIRARKKNVRVNELDKLMSAWDFKFKPTKEGVTYYHPLSPINRMVSVVFHRHSGQEKKVRPFYVKECIKAIDELIEYEVFK